MDRNFRRYFTGIFPQKNPKLGMLQNGSCHGFIDSICKYKGEIQEKFFNTNIQHDGELAVVVFDYSYWKDGQPQNWGKESWNLLKIDGKWKIASVYYSGTLHQVIATPPHLL